MNIRRISRAVIALGVIVACLSPLVAAAACARTYSIGISPTGAFARLEGERMVGIVPRLLEALSHRSGCHFELINAPRARLWKMYADGQIDIVTIAHETRERSALGSFYPFSYLREELVTNIAPPGGSLLAWLELPERPRLSDVRGVVHGDATDVLLTDPRFAAQIDLGDDHATLLRKLVGRTVDGALMSPMTVKALGFSLGINTTRLSFHAVHELPRVAQGFYFRHPNVTKKDAQRLGRLLEDMLSNGESEASIAEIIGKPAAAHLFKHGSRLPIY